ncbi:hypothetical protein [Bacillus sp. AY1-10]|uniref:hypothetical protein n=1 Tax=Bacillus sp. AY1-10 TaxID=2217823 RepID=UPI0015D419F8|nr:hypothetical protein [Bacillus sp. AY1-10]
MELSNMQSVLSVAKEMGGDVLDLFSEGMDYMPHIGRFVQTVKFNRLQRRMEENSLQLQRISQLASSSILAEEYIKQRIFPIVLGEMIEEHEDAKINLLLNGFENVFIEEKENESMVINYFDVISRLRYKDIKRLLYIAGITESFEPHIQESEEEAFIWSIDNKLEINGLVVVVKSLAMINGDNIKPVVPENIKITPFGKEFLNFIQIKKLAES